MPKGIYKRTEYHKQMLRGRTPWNKGERGRKFTDRKSPPPFTAEHRQKMSLAHIGNKYSLGRKLSEEHKRKLSEAHKGKSTRSWTLRGEKSASWKGGITPVNAKIRTSFEYRDWRIAVFTRDNYTCQECGSRGVTLNADHIKPFAYFPELRLVIENGRTLCVPCHKETDTYAGKARNYELKKETKCQYQ